MHSGPPRPSSSRHSLREILDLVCAESGLSLEALQGRGKTVRLANARSCVAVLAARFSNPRSGSAVDRLLSKGDGVSRRLRADHGRRAEAVQSYRLIYARCLSALSPAALLPSSAAAGVPIDVRTPADAISPLASVGAPL